MTVEIETDLSERVLTLTLNRPGRKNALTLGMYTALADAIHDAESRADIRVLVIRGAGDSFTSGNDLMDFMANPPSDENSPVFRFLRALVGCTKPIVAAVHGHAVGIGTTMLLHCDLVYATPEASLQLPFVRLGLVPEAASSHLLVRMLGHARAAELLLLGEPFDGRFACELGIVTRLAERDALDETARSAALKLAALAPEAVRQSKRLMRERCTGPIGESMKSEAEVFSARLRSAEVAEAIGAFMEKRKPDFSRFE